MGQFTPTFNIQEQFDGDTVTIELRRLKNKHQLLLAPHMTGSATGELRLLFEGFVQLAQVAAQVLPDCVVSIHGLADATGAPLGLSDIVEEAYFSPLVVSIMRELMVQSTVAGVEKKSVEPLPSESAA